MQERLTASHAKTNIGCATCHGVCDAHIADESWASGAMAPRPTSCFPLQDLLGLHRLPQAGAGLREERETQAILVAIAYQEKVCTDCHGHHHMVVRKCKWK